ncbi:AAA family ATPase [Paraburkholderia ginsengiterrae]|uniref:AAA family ATPase n=1 Tax=Paraburkholderia ginsengiterrae TaxID=1462993 RepID=UPI0009ED289F|nr:AAA family ATPase [Paraburkholderia ginsengiterrae]
MAKIRKIEIRNFRGICELDWFPSAGINCLIGPGDTGKSTVLDAIDLCLSARRNIVIANSDFHKLDVEQPIGITLTLSGLAYGGYAQPRYEWARRHESERAAEPRISAHSLDARQVSGMMAVTHAVAPRRLRCATIMMPAPL